MENELPLQMRFVKGRVRVVFCGTDVPVDHFVDELTRGGSVDTFLTRFPSVPREFLTAILSQCRSCVRGQSQDYGCWWTDECIDRTRCDHIAAAPQPAAKAALSD